MQGLERPVSTGSLFLVINYEMMLENNIHVYYSIYFSRSRALPHRSSSLEAGREPVEKRLHTHSFSTLTLEDVKTTATRLKDTKGL